MTLTHDGKEPALARRRVGALCALCLVAASWATWPGTARASQLIDRNATGIQLRVDREGRALLTYRAGGRTKHVLVLGNAINAQPPKAGAKQISFRVDYAGGWGFYHKTVWKHFATACTGYDGPPLPWLVTACKAADGSYWAVQSFPQPLPNLGFQPWTARQRADWLELSHWKGPLPQLEVWQGWIYSGGFNEVFGRLTYDGRPVYGFGTTRYGAPTDDFGRLIYLDTLDAPAYGHGWRRENSFVPHNPTGVFCYGFYRFDPTKGGYSFPPGRPEARGPGLGRRYRITAVGPGVTPDVSWEGPALEPFARTSQSDVSLAEQMKKQLESLGDRACLAGHS